MKLQRIFVRNLWKLTEMKRRVVSLVPVIYDEKNGVRCLWWKLRKDPLAKFMPRDEAIDTARASRNCGKIYKIDVRECRPVTSSLIPRAFPRNFSSSLWMGYCHQPLPQSKSCAQWLSHFHQAQGDFRWKILFWRRRGKRDDWKETVRERGGAAWVL